MNTGSVLTLLALGLAVPSALAAERAPAPSLNELTNLPPRLRSFCADKERQVAELAKRLEVELPAQARDFFEDARKGNWVAMFGMYEEVKAVLAETDGSPRERTAFATAGQAALELQLTMEAFVEGEPKYAQAFAEDIIRSIPRGSIYFGGTDAGRGLVTAFSSAHAQGEPFFTLTQNALANGTYLKYLETMYGQMIQVPTSRDSERAFQEYLNDAQRRLQHDQEFPNEPRQLKPGEDVRMANNRVTVGGQVAVMSINARLAKAILDANPGREFFVEESFPLDWMYRHLSPHGLILKLHRQPLEAIPPAIVEQDRKYWLDQARTKIGDWLKPQTPLRDLCQFVEKVFVKQDLAGFRGDPKFVQNANTGRMYSKLRSAIGGIYQHRVNNAKDPAERKGMVEEADFAFRQAFAFAPASPEATFRYINLLVGEKRVDDALLLARTARELPTADSQLENLLEQLDRIKNTK